LTGAGEHIRAKPRASGLPVITHDGVDIDGCNGHTATPGSCQNIDNGGIIDLSGFPSDPPDKGGAFDVRGAGLTISGLNIGGRS
jgi:hypothetical protein